MAKNVKKHSLRKAVLEVAVMVFMAIAAVATMLWAFENDQSNRQNEDGGWEAWATPKSSDDTVVVRQFSF